MKKISRTLEFDVYEIQGNEIIGFFFQNMNCFTWIKLISVLIHLKY